MRFLCLLVRPTLALLSSAFICSPVLARHPQSPLVKVKCERTVSHLDGKISANYYKDILILIIKLDIDNGTTMNRLDFIMLSNLTKLYILC